MHRPRQNHCRRKRRSGSTSSFLFKRLKAEEGGRPWTPDRLNELGAHGWEAVGLSLKYGDLIAWPVVLLKRPLD
jgi:hypothetical protein